MREHSELRQTHTGTTVNTGHVQAFLTQGCGNAHPSHTWTHTYLHIHTVNGRLESPPTSGPLLITAGFVC